MKVKLHIGWKQETYPPEPQLTVWNTEYVSEENGFMNVSTMEVEIDTAPPSKADCTNALVAELRRQQGTLIAESNRLETKIQELLCIEYKPEVTA